jgi:hypothetical protein
MAAWDRSTEGRPAGAGFPVTRAPSGRLKRFAEPVALSSAQPADCPLSRRAFRLGLNLVTLRARREENLTDQAARIKAAPLAQRCDHLAPELVSLWRPGQRALSPAARLTRDAKEERSAAPPIRGKALPPFADHVRVPAVSRASHLGSSTTTSAGDTSGRRIVG